MLGLIYPFIEQNALYDVIVNPQHGGRAFTATAWWFVNMQAADPNLVKQFGVATYRCPSRRGSTVTVAIGTEAPTWENYFWGPQGDYAIPIVYYENGRDANRQQIGMNDWPNEGGTYHTHSCAPLASGRIAIPFPNF